MVAKGIHPSQRALILAHLDAPKHTASWRELAPAVGYPNAEAVKLQYGKLAHRVADELGVTSIRQARGFWLNVLVDWAGQRDKSGHTRYRLRREVVLALHRAGWRNGSAKRRVPARGARQVTDSRSFLVLWQSAEAESWIGRTPSASVGSHMKGLLPGDRIFIASCDDEELYVLGAMRVTSLARHGRGKPGVKGRTLAGAFQMEALGPTKWRLRFENTDSTRLLTSKSLLWQVRSRRQLAPSSADLLLRMLKEGERAQAHKNRLFAREGNLVAQVGTKRERDPAVRRAALKAHGYECMVCCVKPLEVYGKFARECLDVHHLEPLGGGAKRSRTTLKDVIVLCPTCHRALHMSGQPAAWRRFKQDCSFTSGGHT